jgi:NADH-ubiquinone oxidoreductase chain 6
MTQIKHPLAIGIILLIQTIITCLIRGLINKRLWFQYILFIVFVGGMVVLFIYVTRVASNEIFSLSIKTIIITLLVMPRIIIIEN